MLNMLRNIFAIILGLAIGGAVNMTLIMLSPSIIPPPDGVDVSSVESIATAMQMGLYEPKHFIMPFLAHALGTLTGAFIAFLVAASYKTQLAYVIGLAYLCGGIVASYMIPAPIWFIALDIVIAYLPMAWIGILVAKRIQSQNPVSN